MPEELSPTNSINDQLLISISIFYLIPPMRVYNLLIFEMSKKDLKIYRTEFVTEVQQMHFKVKFPCQVKLIWKRSKPFDIT